MENKDNLDHQVLEVILEKMDNLAHKVPPVLQGLMVKEDQQVHQDHVVLMDFQGHREILDLQVKMESMVCKDLLD